MANIIRKTVNIGLRNNASALANTDKSLTVQLVRFSGLLFCLLLALSSLYTTFGIALSEHFAPPYLFILSLMLSAGFLIYPAQWCVRQFGYTLEAWLSISEVGCLWISYICLELNIINTLEISALLYLFCIIDGCYRIAREHLWKLIGGILVCYLLVQWGTQADFSVNAAFFGEAGIYSQQIEGMALTTMIEWVMPFIFFTAAVRLLHINRLFNRWAFQLTHGRRFGFSSALYTILFSAFYGALSGSPRGNITETAQTTLPIMKQAGYKSEFSAMLEATASSLGQMLPPVFGISVFLIIRHSEQNISYGDMLLSSLLPGLLLIIILCMNAIIMAKSIAPMKLVNSKDSRAYLEEWAKHQKAQLWILSIGILLLFLGFALDLPLALSGLLGTLGILLAAGLFSTKTGWLTTQDFLVFAINCGKDTLSSLLICSITGLILVILFDTPLLESFKTFITLIKDWLHISIVLLLSIALILALGLLFPTVTVFLITLPFILPLLQAFNIPDLQAYWFIFFYAIFAGITPPYAPLAEEAASLAKGEGKVFDKSLLHHFSFPILVLTGLIPIIWIQHPSLLLATPNASLASSIPLFIILMIILLAAAISLYQILNKYDFLLKPADTANYNVENFFTLPAQKIKKQLILFALCLIAIASPWLLLSSTIAFFIIIFLIQQEWHSPHSFLHSAFYLLKQVITPKNISPSLWFSFAILMLVYLTYFTASGFAYHFEQQAVRPSLQDRFHMSLETAHCQHAQIEIERFMQRKAYRADTACVTTGHAHLINKESSDLLITKVQLTESFERLGEFVPKIPQTLLNSYWLGLETFNGGCLNEASLKMAFPSLSEAAKNIKQPIFLTQMDNFTSSTCAKEYGLNATDLPIIYMGSQLADTTQLKTGMIVSLNAHADIEQMTNIKNQQFPLTTKIS